MIEGSPDALVIRGERLPVDGRRRDIDVDEHVCLWTRARPAGAPPIVRLLEERARGMPTAWPPPRSTLLVRPLSLAHVHFAFNGEVTLDVVTDKLQLERPAFEQARQELAREAAEWRPRVHHVINVVVTRLQSTLRDGG